MRCHRERNKGNARTDTHVQPSQRAGFALRVFHLDASTCTPLPPLDDPRDPLLGGDARAKRVPALRAFGVTPAGQKCVCHIRGCYPYLYVPVPPGRAGVVEDAVSWARRIAMRLEGELATRERARAYTGVGSTRHVRAAALVRARELYGFSPQHVQGETGTARDALFVRLTLYSPNELSAAAAAARTLGTRPLEAHIPFIMRALIDLNLVGQGVMLASRAYFRAPLPNVGLREFGDSVEYNQRLQAEGVARPNSQSSGLQAVWNEATVRPEWRWASVCVSPPRRTATCALEVDVAASDILNVGEVTRVPLSQACADVHLVQSLAFVWEAEAERCAAEGTEAPVFEAKLPSAEDRNLPDPDGHERALQRAFAAAAEVAGDCNRGTEGRTEGETEGAGGAVQSVVAANDLPSGEHDPLSDAWTREEQQQLSDEAAAALVSQQQHAQHHSQPTPRRLQAPETQVPLSQTSQGDLADILDWMARGGSQAQLPTLQQMEYRVGTPIFCQDPEALTQALDPAMAPPVTDNDDARADEGPLELSQGRALFDSGAIGEERVMPLMGEDHSDEEDPEIMRQGIMHTSTGRASQQVGDDDGGAGSDGRGVDGGGEIEGSDERGQVSDPSATQAESDSLVLMLSAPDEAEEALESDVREETVCVGAHAHVRAHALTQARTDLPASRRGPTGVAAVASDKPNGSDGICGSGDSKQSAKRRRLLEMMDTLGGSAKDCGQDAGGGNGNNALGDDGDASGEEEAMELTLASGTQSPLPSPVHGTGGSQDAEQHDPGAQRSQRYKYRRSSAASSARPAWRASTKIPVMDIAEAFTADGKEQNDHTAVESRGGPQAPFTLYLSPSQDVAPSGNSAAADLVSQVSMRGLIAYRYTAPPPTDAEIAADLDASGLPLRETPLPYWGDIADVGGRTVEIGREIAIASADPARLPPFFGGDAARALARDEQYARALARAYGEGAGAPVQLERTAALQPKRLRAYTMLLPPPSCTEVDAWLDAVARNFAAERTRRRRGTSAALAADANTGKLVPASEHERAAAAAVGDASDNPDGTPVRHLEPLPRPHSPKYDDVYQNLISGGTQVTLDTDAGRQGAETLEFASPATYATPSMGHAQVVGADAGRDSDRNGNAHAAEPSTVRRASGPQSSGKGAGAVVREAAGLRGAVKTHVTPGKAAREAKEHREVARGSLANSAGHSQAYAAGGGVGASHLTVMSVEIACPSRGGLLACPRSDAVHAIAMAVRINAADMDAPYERALIVDITRCPSFAARKGPRGLGPYASQDSGDRGPVPESTDDGRASATMPGFCGAPGFLWDACTKAYVMNVGTEADLMDAFAQTVTAIDPEILLGYDTQRASLGYLLERAAILRGTAPATPQPPASNTTPAQQRPRAPGDFEPPPLSQQLSRFPEQRASRASTDAWNVDHGSGINIPGRVVLNGWRVMRKELQLTIYSAQVAAEAVLGRRVPSMPPGAIASMLGQRVASAALVGASHLLRSATINLELIERLDIVGRNAEFARVFGIPFLDVMLRGSQYRVESLLARLCRTQNYLLASPSKEEVASQPALEALPLIMEPEGKFYTDPVVVLDFTSLYPSMVIAYNLCYSTCLGKVPSPGREAQGLGPLRDWRPPAGALREHARDAIISPSGTAFAPPSKLRGVLPRMLQELLATRAMVKRAMKSHTAQRDRALYRALNARQMGLKLIANVTYGYTSASFSGRMPCAEIADSIVSFGRRTLERAIAMVEGNPEWNAKVVYGDTDSMFVLLPGRDRLEAHAIGHEMSKAVTGANPPPVELKFEKVYQPCILASKKRYVGYMYETALPTERPKFDAKGIETVRRDGCGACRVAVEGAIRALFAANDVSAAKRYVREQASLILRGRCALEQLVFAKEVKLGSYASPPPAAVVAYRAMAIDRRAEPPRGERVRFVVCWGAPGSNLVDRCFDPRDVALSRGALRPCGQYYVDKVIVPALQRSLGLLGCDVSSWLADMPREVPTVLPAATAAAAAARRQGGGGLGARRLPPRTIDAFFASARCVMCGETANVRRPKTAVALCDRCRGTPQATAMALIGRMTRLERVAVKASAVCVSCGGGDGMRRLACDSIDCPVYTARARNGDELHAVSEALATLGLTSRGAAAAATEKGITRPYGTSVV